MDNLTSTDLTRNNSQNTLSKEVFNAEYLGEQISIVSAMISGREPSPFATTYANDIIESFPDMDIKDVIEAMKKGRRGEFGIYYKLNGTVLYDWVKKYEIELRKRNPNVKYNSAGRPIVGDYNL